LKHDPGDHKRNLVHALRCRPPVGELFDMRLGYFLAITVAQNRLQHDADRHRQTGDLGYAGLFECRKAVELAGFSGRRLKFLKAVVKVMRHAVLPGVVVLRRDVCG